MGRMEKLVNFVIVVVCIAIVGDIVRRNFSPAEAPAAPPSTSRPTYKPGETFDAVDGFKPTAGKASLVLAVKDGCGYCAASMPFYQRIAARLQAVPAEARSLEFVSVCPASSEECSAYLKSHALTVDRVAGIQKGGLADIKVAGTPTLMLVDASGKVEAVWVGQLSQKREGEVMDAIGKRVTH